MRMGSERYPAEPKVTLLIVDDDEDTRAVLADCVADRGFHIVLARRGDEALALAQSARPDVILLDLRMPELDGFEVMRRLRADPATREIPVIVLSAEAIDRMELALEESGCVAAIKKPCSVEALVEAIERVVEADPTRDPAPITGPGPEPARSAERLPRSA